MYDPQGRLVALSTIEAPTQNLSHIFVDADAGIAIFSKLFFGGLAVKHLIRPNQSFYESNKSLVPLRIAVHAGMDFKKKGFSHSNIIVSPNIMYVQQASFKQLMIRSFVKKDMAFGGIWMRHVFSNIDAAVLLAGVTIKFFKIGYSYDVTVSKLSNATAGSYELSFALQFECRPKKRKFRTISCPSF